MTARNKSCFKAATSRLGDSHAARALDAHCGHSLTLDLCLAGDSSVVAKTRKHGLRGANAKLRLDRNRCSSCPRTVRQALLSQFSCAATGDPATKKGLKHQHQGGGDGMSLR